MYTTVHVETFLETLCLNVPDVRKNGVSCSVKSLSVLLAFICQNK